MPVRRSMGREFSVESSKLKVWEEGKRKERNSAEGAEEERGVRGEVSARYWLGVLVEFAKAGALLSHSKLVEGGAEFEDAGADGFYGDGEGEGGGFVEEEDYAVEFAFADAACEGEADGMEGVAAGAAAGFFWIGDDLFEAFGVERRGIKEVEG